MQYDELQQQAMGLNATELDAARQTIRPGKDQDAIQRLQTAYGKRFDSQIITQIREDVGELLNEATEVVSVRKHLQQPVEQQDERHYKKPHIQER